MLDSNAMIANKFNYSINAVSGLLRKSHPNSKITHAQIGSPFWKSMTDNESPYILRYKEKVKVIVLQVMILPDNYLLIEYVEKDEF